MLPHQFRRLTEFLRGQFGVIEKVIHDQTAATYDAQKAAHIERRDIPRITASLIYPDAERQADATNREQTHREQEQLITSQNRIADWTRNACLAAVFYGLIALVQGILMWRTYCQIENQTTLMRQETIGNQGAVLVFDPTLSVPAIVAAVRPIPGRVVARDVKVRMIAQRISLPEKKPIGKPIPCDIDAPQVVASESPSLVLLSGSIHACYLPDFDQSSMDEVMHTRQSVSISGTFSYLNGFDELKSQSFCKTYLGYRFSGFIRGDRGHPTSGEDASFHDCADFDGALRRALDFKKKYGDSYISQNAP